MALGDLQRRVDEERLLRGGHRELLHREALLAAAAHAVRDREGEPEGCSRLSFNGVWTLTIIGMQNESATIHGVFNRIYDSLN